jgi:hypothetical protein
MRTELSSQSVVEAVVTIAVALLFTFAAYEMLADASGGIRVVQAAAAGHGA